MTRTWTDTLATFEPIGPEEREELEAQVKLVATNAAGAFAGTKRSFAMLATHLGAELEAAKERRDWAERSFLYACIRLGICGDRVGAFIQEALHNVPEGSGIK